jgi:hypothetical protein
MIDVEARHVLDTQALGRSAGRDAIGDVVNIIIII